MSLNMSKGIGREPHSREITVMEAERAPLSLAKKLLPNASPEDNKQIQDALEKLVDPFRNMANAIAEPSEAMQALDTIAEVMKRKGAIDPARNDTYKRLHTCVELAAALEKEATGLFKESR